MIEVEVKVHVSDKLKTEENLLQLDFAKGNLVRETDYYFDNEAGNFRKSDKALRIRECENLSQNTKEAFMTYKGQKLDNISMTRKELEIKIDDAKTGKEILENLGFTPVRPVIKLRQYFHKDTMTACLDQVEGLGDFLELEIVVENESEKGDALDKLLGLLGELGYRKEEIIRTSYLSMIQKKEKTTGY